MSTDTDSKKVTALRLRDAVLCDRSLPHGAKVIWWLIHTRLMSTAEGVQTGVVTVTIKGFLEAMTARRNSICVWTRLLREKGYLLIKEGPARHGEFPCNQFFLPPSIPKATAPCSQRDTRSGSQRDTRSGSQKATLLRDKKRQEEGGEGGNGKPPLLAAQGKDVKAGASPLPEKALPPFQSSLPLAQPANGVPKFSEVPANTFHSTLCRMLTDAQAELTKEKANPDNQTRELKKDVKEIVEDYLKHNRPRAAERVAQLKADPRNWQKTGYTDHGQAVVKAWQARVDYLTARKLGKAD